MRELPPLPPGLRVLVILICLIELVLTASDYGIIGKPYWRAYAVVYLGFDDLLFDGLEPARWPGQFWAMFLSHAFLHGDILHLGMNMAALLGLGKLTSGIVGPTRATLLFFLAAIGGALAFGLIARTEVPMVGASGAVFGYLGLWQAAELRMRMLRGLPLRPVFTGMAGLVLANALIWVAFSGMIAWEAHLGGYLAGWAFSLVILFRGGAARP